MTAKSMLVRAMGQLLLVVHPSRPPSGAEWDHFVTFSREKQQKGPIQMLVVTQGGAPNAAQRIQCRVLFESGPLPVAVLSDSALVRGVVTALSWFNPGIRGFSFRAGAGIHDALKYLQLDELRVDHVLTEIRAMQREVGADVDG
jgi:hypothetical protein